MSLPLRDPTDVLEALGARAQRLRLVRRTTQEEVAARAGVGVATLKRFERSGRTSIENVLRIALALGAEDGFEGMFATPPPSIDEALARSKLPRRIRRPR